MIANPYVALVIGSVAAYLIDYAGTRLLIFGTGGRAIIRGPEQSICGPREVEGAFSADDVPALDLDTGRLAGGGLAGPAAVETPGR